MKGAIFFWASVFPLASGVGEQGGNLDQIPLIGPVTRKVEGIENLQYSKKAVISKLKKKNTML